MNFKANLTSNSVIKSIFVVFLFILISIAAINYRHTTNLTDSNESVMRSHKIYIELEQLMSYIKDTETGQRGFIITQDTIYLHSSSIARKNVMTSFKILKELTKDNLHQKENRDSLYSLINLNFAYLDISLKMSSKKNLDKKLFDSILLRGKQVMDDIRVQIKKMIDLETGSLKQREAKFKNEIFVTPIFILLLLLFSLSVFVFSYFKITHDFEILKISNNELRITMESFQHAEVIGDFGISEWDLKTNTLQYSDNLYKLLGCKPQSFEASVENFLEFVHTDDRHIVTTGAENVLENASTYARFYRIIRKDGELRYFRSLGKFISDDDDEHKTHIGIIKDVTENHLNNLEMEERNRELEQTNAELASFNHIASHDLQEPLRKIQLFISRINENNKETISQTGKEYLVKIQSAVERMRTLIDDLLVFSRANKSEKVFELCDLNQLLDNAKQELMEVIEEKTAIIKSEQLPTLNVIPFQIQQLFINLIGNSLKYSKANTAPEIDISCEKIIAKDYPILKTDDNKVFYKITFTDNGLGFDQQYAESIFVLFNRLHQSSQYSGTGIGLSICKKIVENHAGFIMAEGILDIGSTFSVFFPE